MYNRYQGNSGLVRRVEDGPGPAPAPPPPPPRHAPPPPPLMGLGGLTERLLGSLETEDLLLMLILYFLYRESGDGELLLILGALLLA